MRGNLALKLSYILDVVFIWQKHGKLYVCGSAVFIRKYDHLPVFFLTKKKEETKKVILSNKNSTNFGSLKTNKLIEFALFNFFYEQNGYLRGRIFSACEYPAMKKDAGGLEI